MHRQAATFRNVIASAGLTIINSFFESDLKNFPDDAARAAWAAEQIQLLGFLYKVPGRRAGLMRSPFIIATIATYFIQIDGAVSVPELSKAPFYHEDPVGAMAMCTVAVSVTRTCVFSTNCKLPNYRSKER